MDEKFFTQFLNQPKGKILLETEAIPAGLDTPMKVQLCERLIVFGKMCLEHNFDLKFCVKEEEVLFEQHEKIHTFKLPRNDGKMWRDVLKLYLNQKGFHEIFKPIKKIGKGNFASVYLVEKIENKMKYAVKAFSKESAYSEENGKECLMKEIEIMRHLNYHSLMKLEEVFESDNSLYIVFELLEGGQLYDKIKYQFKPSETKTMMKDLLEGLKEMHSKGIMHRDLKPENILLRSKDKIECVIADFGLSEFVNADEYLFVRCGTPGYVAPEVINIKDMKKKYSSICDIFSLGLIFHVFLFGFSLFRKKTYNEVLAENRACKYNFEEEFYGKVAPETLDLLKKMLRVDPDERITAEQALSHPYFKLVENDEPQMVILKNKISSASTSSPESPVTKGEETRKVNKDSCIEFKLGKENVVTGKTDTVTEVGQTKGSMFGQAMTPGRVSKISKFSRPI